MSSLKGKAKSAIPISEQTLQDFAEEELKLHG